MAPSSKTSPVLDRIETEVRQLNTLLRGSGELNLISPFSVPNATDLEHSSEQQFIEVNPISVGESIVFPGSHNYNFSIELLLVASWKILRLNILLLCVISSSMIYHQLLWAYWICGDLVNPFIKKFLPCLVFNTFDGFTLLPAAVMHLLWVVGTDLLISFRLLLQMLSL